MDESLHLVRPNPYAAVSGKDGAFRIRGAAASSSSGLARSARLPSGQTRVERRAVHPPIDAGRTNDLGDIMLEPELFQR